MKASFAAAAGEMVKAVLVAAVRVPDAAPRVYPEAALLMERSVNCAIPLSAFAVTVPESVPPPALFAKFKVTEALEPVTVLLKAS